MPENLSISSPNIDRVSASSGFQKLTNEYNIKFNL